MLLQIQSLKNCSKEKNPKGLTETNPLISDEGKPSKKDKSELNLSGKKKKRKTNSSRWQRINEVLYNESESTPFRKIQKILLIFTLTSITFLESQDLKKKSKFHFLTQSL